MTSENATPPVKPTSPRYLFLDAVRGLTALAVLLFHLLANEPMGATLREGVIAPLANNFQLLTWRVPVFFVLSGFVIALSLRNVAVNRGLVGNFLLRRLVRLMPLYWTVLVLCLGFQWGERFVPGLTAEPLPPARDLALNFLLLQNLFHAQPVIYLAWTLCLELQFYLFYLGLLLLSNLITRFWSDATRESALPLLQDGLLFASGVVSLAVVLRWPSQTEDASMLHYWYFFVAGVFSFRAFYGRTSLRVLAAFCGCVLLALAVSWWLRPERFSVAWVPMASAIWVSLLFYYAGRAGHLERWLSWAPLQSMARISYSLYLIHFLVLVWVFRLSRKVSAVNEVNAALWSVVAIAVSFGAAFVFYRWVEGPCVVWSARLKKRTPTSPLPSPGERDSVLAPSSPAMPVQQSLH